MEVVPMAEQEGGIRKEQGSGEQLGMSGGVQLGGMRVSGILDRADPTGKMHCYTFLNNGFSIFFLCQPLPPEYPSCPYPSLFMAADLFFQLSQPCISETLVFTPKLH
jgi:hypothetical protein